MSGKADTRTDRIISHLKNHWLVSGLIVFGIVVTAVSQFSTAVHGLYGTVRPGPPAPLVAEYCNLLVPLVVQLDRTKDAFDRWNNRNLPLEKQTIRDGNLKARDLLQKYSQLVPAELQDDRRKLVEHYDRWIEEYQRLRQDTGASDEPFVFVYSFPRDSEDRFRARLEFVRRRLGPQPTCPASPGQ